jgi:hypothetical protein
MKIARCIVVVLLPLILTGCQNQLEENQKMARLELHSLNGSCDFYHSFFGSYPKELSDLGPPPGPGSSGHELRMGAKSPLGQNPRHADIVTPQEAAGHGVGFGYVFTYHVLTIKDGRVTRYDISARPEQWGKTGRASYHTDEQGFASLTLDNREATDNDTMFNLAEAVANWEREEK